ncbi:MAG: Integral rane protein [Chthoniobacter sp.]|nr:Integral rane protein [Chthoniobacter sp.]
MRQRGTVRKWNDEKGFGFIAAEDETADVFFHIKALGNRGLRPQEGDTVTFETTTDERQRVRAADVRLSKGAPLGAVRSTLTCFAAAFITALIFAAWQGRIPSAVPAIYAVASAFTAAVYTSDKSRAGRAQWRTPEKTLHLLELCGGWPGALIAQHWVRHKVGKLSFQIIFWLIVAAHLVVWVFVVPRFR